MTDRRHVLPRTRAHVLALALSRLRATESLLSELRMLTRDERAQRDLLYLLERLAAVERAVVRGDA